ncbi:MAG: NADH:ubiquinone reductase (Na(+)-transporting) subunit B [Planctomycetes bacterium]|nr:NADH:ubiquinone reductase (Na(+)-transporting) subunit B [Planctomycetota bacterium]
MRPLRKALDRLHPLFGKGGKLEKFYPAYEAIDTFLYTPGEITKGASHVRDAMDLKRMMITVVAALTPCILMAMVNTGYQANLALETLGKAANPAALADEGWRYALMNAIGVGYNSGNLFYNFVHGALYFVPVFLVCNIVGGTWEGIFATVRKHEINEGFLVTGMLFPLTLPPTIPLWQVAVGISFGVVIGKEVFGGTGKNFLNPALTARAFLYFAYPAQISGDIVWTAADGFSGATPLGAAAAGGMSAVAETWGQAFLGTMQGSMGETSALACLIGAIVLIATGVGSWRIMAGVLIGALGLSTLLWAIGSEKNFMFEMNPMWHLVVGGFAFGTVFMATDPVSAAMTQTGKWVYGVLIGVMTILIRVINPAFPEGIMLAILFGNVFAPVIDHYVLKANIKRRLIRTSA